MRKVRQKIGTEKWGPLLRMGQSWPAGLWRILVCPRKALERCKQSSVRDSGRSLGGKNEKRNMDSGNPAPKVSRGNEDFIQNLARAHFCAALAKNWRRNASVLKTLVRLNAKIMGSKKHTEWGFKLWSKLCVRTSSQNKTYIYRHAIRGHGNFLLSTSPYSSGIF